MDFTINKFDPTLSTVLCSFTLLDVVPISFLTVGSSGAVFFATFDGYVRAVDMSGMLVLLFYFELSSMSWYVYIWEYFFGAAASVPRNHYLLVRAFWLWPCVYRHIIAWRFLACICAVVMSLWSPVCNSDLYYHVLFRCDFTALPVLNAIACVKIRDTLTRKLIVSGGFSCLIVQNGLLVLVIPVVLSELVKQ